MAHARRTGNHALFIRTTEGPRSRVWMSTIPVPQSHCSVNACLCTRAELAILQSMLTGACAVPAKTMAPVWVQVMKRNARLRGVKSIMRPQNGPNRITATGDRNPTTATVWKPPAWARSYMLPTCLMHRLWMLSTPSQHEPAHTFDPCHGQCQWQSKPPGALYEAIECVKPVPASNIVRLML